MIGGRNGGFVLYGILPWNGNKLKAVTNLGFLKKEVSLAAASFDTAVYTV